MRKSHRQDGPSRVKKVGISVTSFVVALAVCYGIYLGLFAPFRVAATVGSQESSGYVDMLIARYASSDLVPDSTQTVLLTDQPVKNGVARYDIANYLRSQGTTSTRLRICSQSEVTAVADGMSEGTRSALEACSRGEIDSTEVRVSCDTTILYGGVRGLVQLIGSPIFEQAKQTITCAE